MGDIISWVLHFPFTKEKPKFGCQMGGKRSLRSKKDRDQTWLGDLKNSPSHLAYSTGQAKKKGSTNKFWI